MIELTGILLIKKVFRWLVGLICAYRVIFSFPCLKAYIISFIIRSIVDVNHQAE